MAKQATFNLKSKKFEKLDKQQSKLAQMSGGGS